MAGDLLLSLDLDQTTVPEVRRSVHDCAGAAGLSGLGLDDYVLAVHEAVTNAVRYAKSPRLLRLWREGARVLCEVSDGGPGIATGSLRTPTGGRGLWLMHRLTTIVVSTAPDGTTVRLTAGVPQG
ncbi:ATP-binding protein [Herbidospora mongoliensis]|uniref:ATP-binding protein n=1 Tax=Herbidospora mongoliensis TaxID=688067 RepID=UPI00082A4B2A|nr:ATP-binding protein [Herbidospora mongoliensis]